MRLLWQPVAETDLDAIWDFGAEEWGHDQADGYIREIRRRAEALARKELSGTDAGDVAKGLRRLVSGSHVIWFRIEGDVLRVIRVLHASRDAGR